MSLVGALSIATSGLKSIQDQIALVSQNVANASTPGYVREVSVLQSVYAGDTGAGVRSAVVTRDIDTAVQASVFQQAGVASGLQTRADSLSSVNAALGQTASGNDLASVLGRLRDAFSALSATPGNQAQQNAVVTAAGTVASSVNSLSATYVNARQAAQDSIVDQVSQLTQSLSTIGQLSKQIVAQQASGQSTADLENARDTELQTVAQLTGAKSLFQANGDVLIYTQGGVVLPTRSGDGTVATSAATTGAGATYPATIPPITLGGQDITKSITGGSIGANITLRDATLPTYQAELDEFAKTLAGRFDAQGLRLFTDGGGGVPAGGGSPPQTGYVGFAGQIKVNATVIANPALVRDGTQNVAGSATGASAFTVNPSGGPADFSTLVVRVLDQTFGTEIQPGVTQPAAVSTNLGPLGGLTAPYGSGSLTDLATSLVASQAQDSAQATTNSTSAHTYQSTLQQTLANRSSVSIDTELSHLVQLQNAYGANAKIVSANETLFDQLLAVLP